MMNLTLSRDECSREPELLEAIAAGRWPDGAVEELRAHVATCPGCKDLASVATAFADDTIVAVRNAPIPSAAVMWWRVHRRAEAESRRTAGRTLTLVQTATLAATIIGVLSILGGLALMQDWHLWFDAARRTLGDGTSNLLWSLRSTEWNKPLLIAVATTLLLAPVAAYFVIAREG